MEDVHAHSLPGEPVGRWESLRDHAAAVAHGVDANAAPLGWTALAIAAGLLHDVGKCAAAFQAYLRARPGDGRGPDHSTAGAIEARRLYPGPIGRILAFAVAGHHAGLADGAALAERLTKTVPDYAGWDKQVGALPDRKTFGPLLRTQGPHRGFSLAFLIRMLFSCLVDADFIATEAFYARAEGRTAPREGFTSLPVLHERLRRFMAAKRAGAEATPLNQLRGTTLDHAIAKAELPPGFFTLTVPTGGGKTLASLSFALDHAVRHNLRRIVYVIPFGGARIETSARAPERPSWPVAPSLGSADRNTAEKQASFAQQCRSLTGERGSKPDPAADTPVAVTSLPHGGERGSKTPYARSGQLSVVLAKRDASVADEGRFLTPCLLKRQPGAGRPRLCQSTEEPNGVLWLHSEPSNCGLHNRIFAL